MRYLLVLAAIVFALHACQEDIPFETLDQSLMYKIDQARDTTLSLGQGVVAMITANTFPKEDSQLILRVEVVRTVQDALLAGLTTITDDGKYLSSEAMVRIRKQDGDTLDFAQAVELKVSTDLPVWKMHQFIGVSGENRMVKWNLISEEPLTIQVDSFLLLESELNKGFTTYPTYALDALGNAAAIVAIDTFYFESEVAFYGDRYQVGGGRNSEDLNDRSPTHYLLFISSSSWVNVDGFINRETNVTPLEFRQGSGKDFPQGTGIFVLFPNRSMVIPYEYSDDFGWGLLNSFSKDSLNLPLGDPYYVVAFSGTPLNQYVIEKHEVKLTNPPNKLRMKKGTRAQYNKELRETIEEE